MVTEDEEGKKRRRGLAEAYMVFWNEACAAKMIDMER